MPFCIQCTLPLENCICCQWPKLTLHHYAILFHPREKQKRTSTGRLIARLGNIQSNSWHRLNSEQLHRHYSDYKLVYPICADHDNLATQAASTPNPHDKLLFIDGTWQQAAKMLRQSPWLNQLPRVSISQTSPSMFRLRRNQTENGLSTLEAMAFCLFEQGRSQSSQDLLEFFALFQSGYLNARDSGAFKH